MVSEVGRPRFRWSTSLSPSSIEVIVAFLLQLYKVILGAISGSLSSSSLLTCKLLRLVNSNARFLTNGLSRFLGVKLPKLSGFKWFLKCDDFVFGVDIVVFVVYRGELRHLARIS